jgi:cyanate permease
VFGGPLLLIIAWMIATWGWRQAFFALGVASLVILVPLALVYRTKPEQYGMLPDGDPAPPGGVQAVAAAPIPAAKGGHGAPPPTAATADGVEQNFTTKQALKSPAFWILVILFGAQQFGTGAVNVHLVNYLQKDVGFGVAEAASVLGFFTVLSIFGRLGGGWAIDRFGARITMAVLVAFMAIGFFILVNMSAYWMVPVYALVYGTAFGGLMTGRSVIIANFFGRNSFGTISGILNSATVPVAIVAPVFMGWVFDTTGTYRPAIWVMIAIAAIAVPLTMLARPPKALPGAPSTPKAGAPA